MSRVLKSVSIAVVVLLAHDPACADDSARRETATVLSLPFSDDGFIDREISEEILGALTAIQENHHEVRQAYSKNWYDLHSLLLLFPPEQEDAVRDSSTVYSISNGKTLLASTGIEEIDKLNEKFNVASVELTQYGWLHLTFEEPMAMLEVKKAYERLKSVKFATLNEFQRSSGSFIAVDANNGTWEFKISAPCTENSTDCTYASYKYHYFTYDRGSQKVKKTREEGILSILNCSPSAISVIEKYDTRDLQSCHTQTYANANDNEEVDLVTIRYGEGMDCPSGCIFDELSAIVDREGIHASPGDRGVSGRETSDRFGRVCGQAAPAKRLLYRADDQYQWVEFYTDAHSKDIYGSQCVLNGYALGSENDSRIEIDAEYPSISSCSDEVIEQAWATHCAQTTTATCEYDKRTGFKISQDICLERTAAIRNEPTLCERITHKTHKSYCYFNLAMARLEERTCAHIAPEEHDHVRARCREGIRKYLKYRESQSGDSALESGEFFSRKEK